MGAYSWSKLPWVGESAGGAAAITPLTYGTPAIWWKPQNAADFNGTGITDGGVITSLVDHGSLAIAPTPQGSPTWKANAINGKGAINLVGSSHQYFDMGSTQAINSGQPFTLFYVVSLNAFNTPVDAAFPCFMGMKNDTGEPFILYFVNNQGGWDWAMGSPVHWARQYIVHTWALPEAHLYVVTYNGSGATTTGNFGVYFDEVSQTLNTAGAFGGVSDGNGSLGTLFIGGSTPATDYCTAYIGEWFLYNNVLLTPTQITTLASQYILPTWGVG